MNPLTDFDQAVEVQENPGNPGKLISPAQKNPVLDFQDAVDPESWTGSVGHARTPEIISAYKPKPLLQRITERIVKGSPDERIQRGMNIEHISKATGLDKSEVDQHYEQFMKLPDIQSKAGVEYRPGILQASKDLLDYSMPGLVALGAVTHPLKTAVGVLGFTALDHMVKLQDYIPTDASDSFRSATELADFILKGAILGPAIEKTPSGPSILDAPKFLSKYFKEKAKEVGIPDILTLSDDKLNSIKQRLSPDEFKDFLHSIGITPAHDDAAGEGVDIQFPTEKLFESMVSKLATEKDVSRINEEAPPSERLGIKIEVPKPRRGVNLSRAIDNGSIYGVVRALGGFSVGEDLKGEMGQGQQKNLTMQKMIGVYRKNGPGIDMVLQEAKEVAPGLFKRFDSGAQLLDYFKNRTLGKEGEFKTLKSYEKERSEEYEREIQSLTERAIDAGISPDVIRKAIEDSTQAGKTESASELDSGTVTSELKEADPSFDFGANVEEKQTTIPGTESKFSEKPITPTDKSLIQDQGELFDPDKKYSVASVFYSALERAIDQKMPSQAPKSQVMGIIESSGIPKDQLDWIDLPSFLKDKETVSKSEFLDYIRQNDVKVEEVEKGSMAVSAEKLSEAFQETSNNVWLLGGDKYQYEVSLVGKKWQAMRLNPVGEAVTYSDTVTNLGQHSTLEGAKNIVIEDALKNKPTSVTETKFSAYQLPGGENYKELLLTLPSERTPVTGYKIMKEGYRIGGDFKTEEDARAFADALKLNPRTGYNIAKIGGERTADTFSSSHFDEPNVLAHVRFNDRTDTEGKKVLFLEEVQSDWHQKGRKSGYKDVAVEQKAKVAFDEYGQELAKKYQLNPLHNLAMYKTIKGMTDAEVSKYEELQSAWIDSGGGVNGGVPNAPFKKTWHELALKRMLRYAAENGYDKLAWTTGEQQAERYDLSKQVDRIEYIKQPNGKYAFNALKNGAVAIGKSDLSISQVEEYLGKDVAEKVSKDYGFPDTAGFRVLEGVDLKVGGEGMKGFYDQIIPSFLNKYTKKWGGRVMTSQIEVRPGESDVAIIRNEDGTFTVLDKLDPMGPPIVDHGSKAEADKFLKESTSHDTVHSLEITPSMKQSVLYEGQRYSVGQPKNQAEQLRVIEEGRKLFDKLAHKGNNLVIEANLKTDQGENALGWFMKYASDKGLTKIDPRTGLDTYHHEMGHGILNLAYTGDERRAIFDEVKTHWGAVDDRAAEEMMMDAAKSYYDWVSDGKDPDKFFSQKQPQTYTEKISAFIKDFIENIKQFLGFSSEEQNMKNLKKFYEDLYSGARKEVTASDEENFSRYKEANDPKEQREILKSKPYYDKIKHLLTDKERPPNEIIPERFQDGPSQPIGSQVTSAGIAFKTGGERLIEAVNKVFNPATAAKRAAGDKAYASVIKAFHTPDAEMIGFNNARSAIFDLNFQEIEKLFNRLSKKEVENFNLIRGQAEDPSAMMLQEDANKDILKSFKLDQVKNLVGAVKEISDYVFEYLKENKVELNYFKDYFYGAYKDPNRAQQFVEYWQHTDRFTKDKVFPTIADAQAYGLELRDPNPVTNLRSEMRAAALKVGLRNLREVMEKEGHNYTAKMQDLSPEQKRSWKKIQEATFNDLRFDPDYADMVNSLLSTNKISSNFWLSGMRNAVYLGQQIKFFGSLFHLRNVTKAAVSDETMGIFNKEGYKNVIKSFKPIDQASPEYKEYVNLGGGHKYSVESQAQVALMKNLDKLAGGSWLGKAIEGSKWIPASPKMIEWMFEDYIPSIKFNRFMQEIKVQEDRLGRPLEDSEKINVIRANQNFYGEMNERLFGRSGTVTTALRFVFLAPGYAEGNYRALFQSIGDISRKATGKPISEQGQRNAQFIASSLVTTLAMATVGTIVMTGQAPTAPKNGRDVRDLFKMKTGLKDGNGDDLFIDMMGYDNDFYAVYGNLLTGKAGDIPGALAKRLSGMTSGMFRTINDITTIMNGGMVYDFRGLPIYYKTDELPEKVGKFMEYEATQAGAISFQSLLDAQRKGVGLPGAAAGAVIGLRTTPSEEVKETKKARNDIFTLEDSKRGKTLDLNKLYKENPDRALEEAKKYNETQVKKVVHILKKVGITEPPPKKFFDNFIIKGLKGAASIEEGTTIESLYKKKKRKTEKVMSQQDKQNLEEFVKENFNQ